jgi:hypothetical protein
MPGGNHSLKFKRNAYCVLCLKDLSRNKPSKSIEFKVTKMGCTKNLSGLRAIMVSGPLLLPTLDSHGTIKSFFI